jgi:hypothetical protein
MTAVVVRLKRPQQKATPPRRRPNAQLRSREYLTPDEVDRLIAAARGTGRHGHRDGTLIMLGYSQIPGSG